MKNITLSVPDDFYRRMRVYAAEHGTTVTALAREALIKLCQDSEFDRMAREQDEIIASIKDFTAGDRLDRDSVHDRDALRRLQHSALRDKQAS